MKDRYSITVDLLTPELWDKKDFLVNKGFNISRLVRNFIIQLYEKEKEKS